jgi:hypothetical protein
VQLHTLITPSALVAHQLAKTRSYRLALKNCSYDLHIDQELMEGSGKWLAQANS